jgi:hypothetical protein
LCGVTAPIPPHKAPGRLGGLSKQCFQRAFMPQCGRLRAMGVCGFEPTDPPPQMIEEDMKDAGANPAPAAATHLAALEVAWTVVPVMILVVIAIPLFRLLTHRLVVPRAGITIKVTASNAIGLIPILKTKVAASNAIRE